MTITKNICVPGKHDKSILTDIFYIENTKQKPVVIFCHGYKGFKDWGAWNVMAETIAKAGFFFIKFNFAYNGGTVNQPIDFPDLEAFGNNNYTKELDDLEAIIDWVCNNQALKAQLDTTNIHLIGHSRGGGIVSIKAEEDQRITKLVSLAGVCNYKNRYPIKSDTEKWKGTGVIYVLNGRTQQQMPHYYQFYKDFVENENRLNIKRAVSNLNIPHLIVHGSEDTSVLIDEALALHHWNPKSKLEVIEGANHVFGAIHPWTKTFLPKETQEAIHKIILFLKT